MSGSSHGVAGEPLRLQNDRVADRADSVGRWTPAVTSRTASASCRVYALPLGPLVASMALGIE
jgi:hypothetical protein